MAPPETLNLNNEVVKMRKDVKRIRVLVIRKLVRSVSRLKTKKGTEDALLKNQRRAQRLLEEIHAMKELKPDVVTKSALSDDTNFEKVCKKPDSTATERAIARLAVHPLLKKKIDTLKVSFFRSSRELAPKSKTPGFQQSEPQTKNQCNTRKQRTLDNARLQLPLHPSWEASRRQKEQQSKIPVFQGKKITFDD
ncbi:serum response factor-binding protein 1 [Echinops telfairi]|uniref:Serum response factor-binding protein 1 n=1 Tax=Echinops telfairi TaxID=9371 RepID=A0AC55CR21_ECHTE|nr:serum response factor-binding protein 1 [Echinops telfairi]